MMKHIYKPCNEHGIEHSPCEVCTVCYIHKGTLDETVAWMLLTPTNRGAIYTRLDPGCYTGEDVT